MTADWALRVQHGFAQLPGAVAPATSGLGDPVAFCREMVEGLKEIRQLLPAPTVEIGIAFVSYVDALLDLYGECPQSQERALALHRRANAMGMRFEALLNAHLSRRDP